VVFQGFGNPFNMDYKRLKNNSGLQQTVEKVRLVNQLRGSELKKLSGLQQTVEKVRPGGEIIEGSELKKLSGLQQTVEKVRPGGES